MMVQSLATASGFIVDCFAT